MHVSATVIGYLAKFVIGDNRFTPRLSGKDLTSLFRSFGFDDEYDDGCPGNLSRKDYAQTRIQALNGSEALKNLLEEIVRTSHFAAKEIELKDRISAIEHCNAVIRDDGYCFQLLDEQYKVVDSNQIEVEEESIEIHFRRIRELCLAEIEAARFTIWIAVAWFTNRNLFESLVNKNKSGVNIQLIIIDDEINRNTGFDFEAHFETYRIKPSGRFGNIMHHKFVVFDLNSAIHGCYNWTNKAPHNKEDVSHSKIRKVAEDYAGRFIELRRDARS
ncbi:MAG: phospholipase D-like domain-containing protein [Planctomycetota bacterium]|nr:phospholipase D-like domain-containing protein [Planctomycetota bacterium]